MFFLWLVIALLFLLFELGNPGLFFFLSFFFGALIAGITSLFLPDAVIQALLFLVASGTSFVALRYWLKKENAPVHKTNVYALEGKRGIVIQTITTHGVGAVKVGGEVWSAKAVDDHSIMVGAAVHVVRVQGSHLIVRHIIAS